MSCSLGHRREDHSKAGFTLIELLIGIALVSAIALLAIPEARRAMSGRTLDAAAAEISAVARMTRAAAIRTGSEHSLAIDLASRRYWAEGVTAPRALPSSLNVKLSLPPLVGATELPHRIRFLPSGSSSGAEIVLTDGARSASVVIDWLTGATRVSP